MCLKKLNKAICFLFIALLLPWHLYAQEEKSNCVLKLEEAQSKYDQGRIQDVESLIEECITNNEFNKVEKAQALKLLTLAYLFLEEPEKAEGSMLDLLKTNHEFAINDAIDPSGFINLYNKFRHEPLFSAGVLLGGTIALPIITQLNGVQDLNQAPRQSYSPKIGFRVGFTFEYKLNEKLFANPGINFSHIAFTKLRENQQIVSGENYESFIGELNFNSVEIPLLIQYQFLEGKFRPYAIAGISPQFFISASYPGDAIKNEILGSPAVSSNKIDLTSDINRFGLSAMIAGGIKIKVTGGFVNFRLRYSHGILPLVNETSAQNPSNPNLLWDLNDSLDGFRVHDLNFSLGYTYHIFIPKKLI